MRSKKNTYRGANCRENERIITLKNIFEKSLDNGEKKFKKYLDLGCGDGNISYEIGKFLKCDNIYGADILVDPDLMAIGVKYLTVENNSIPLEDNSIDFLSCFVCIHHFTDIKKMLLEIKRVLKPGGYLYIREHDIRTKKDYVLINLIHILYGAKYKSYYEGTYFSKIELHDYLEKMKFTELTTIVYPSPNPQKIYHSLFRTDKNDTPYQKPISNDIGLFEGNFDTVEWLNSLLDNDTDKMYIIRTICKKINKMYGFNISETEELFKSVTSEQDLYDKLC